MPFSDPDRLAPLSLDGQAELRFERVIELEQVIATRSVARLAQHLKQAEQAHAAFEQESPSAAAFVDWPKFYAEYLLGVR